MHSAAVGVMWTLVLRAQAMIGSILATVVPNAQVVPAVNPEDLHPDPKVVGGRPGRVAARLVVLQRARVEACTRCTKFG